MADFNASPEMLDFIRGCTIDFDLKTGMSKTVDTGKCDRPSEPFPQKSHVSYMPEWHRQSMTA